MRELISKFSLGAVDAASALRVIDHFDALVDQRASAMAMLRAMTALTECGGGIIDPARDLRVSIDNTGCVHDVFLPPDGSAQVEHSEGITVWLDRARRPESLDQLVLERFLRSVNAVGTTLDARPAVAAVRIACDPNAAAAQREGALQRLGLGPAVTVVAVHRGEGEPGFPALPVDDHEIRLVSPAAADQAIRRGVAAGSITCTGADVHRMWRHAVTALRVAIDPATGRPAHVRFEDLGAVAAVVENVDARYAGSVPDVRRLQELQTIRPWALPTLNAALAHSSIREAARGQNLHHSTLRQRIDWLERQLGYSLRDPTGNARATTALILWRIAAAAAIWRSPRT